MQFKQREQIWSIRVYSCYFNAISAPEFKRASVLWSIEVKKWNSSHIQLTANKTCIWIRSSFLIPHEIVTHFISSVLPSRSHHRIWSPVQQVRERVEVTDRTSSRKRITSPHALLFWDASDHFRLNGAGWELILRLPTQSFHW